METASVIAGAAGPDTQTPQPVPGEFAGSPTGEPAPLPEPTPLPAHACVRAEFNAMVDTCPACPVASNAGAIKGDTKPYRNVVANRWIVHSLLQYHYLPYWPRNVDQVFATIDIRTGTVVAACVFAYPVLRCFQREQVFGQLTPDVINRDFRQLVRWMVDPSHREDGVGTDLLRWALTKVQQPVVEAINRSWVPVKVFRELGMIERSDGDRHYYYRLKEVRKRLDEIANPPAQCDAKPGGVLHEYPRIWTPRIRLEGQARIVFVQPYAGSPVRVHTWHKACYSVMYDENVTVDGLEKNDGIAEIDDQTIHASLVNQIVAGLPQPEVN